MKVTTYVLFGTVCVFESLEYTFIRTPRLLETSEYFTLVFRDSGNSSAEEKFLSIIFIWRNNFFFHFSLFTAAVWILLEYGL
jgi:hypothetical protein